MEEAGRILVPDSFEDTVFASLNPPVNPKSKLYVHSNLLPLELNVNLLVCSLCIVLIVCL